LKLRDAESRAGIAAIGGVESVVQIMKNFPEYQALQVSGCSSLVELTWSNVIGKSYRIGWNRGRSGLCKQSLWFCTSLQKSMLGAELWALGKIASGSKKNTGLLD
jgi:hypothetical protein